MQLTTSSNNVDSRNKKKRKLQRQPNHKRRPSQCRSNNMTLGASWIWTPTMINLRMIISNQTKKIHSALNHERVSMARKPVMGIINQGREVCIGVSNNQYIILSKLPLINTSRASLTSRDGRATMTCGDTKTVLLSQRRHSNYCIILQRRLGSKFFFWVTISAAWSTYTWDGAPSIQSSLYPWSPSRRLRGSQHLSALPNRRSRQIEHIWGRSGRKRAMCNGNGRENRGSLYRLCCWIERGIFPQWQGAMYITTRTTKCVSMLYLFQIEHLNNLPIPCYLSATWGFFTAHRHRTLKMRNL